ncbi:hypothetical protein JQK88_29115 [Mesorhizobium caraganae]|uniref:hypothetical protein n=1 Tax=Mesorhizobium caraganae TaxID=483206 RepID=UPI0019399B37|nr:hypothetical protein [Mesorhizobium caraganae]MBM2715205.1 hypothetical protein [Mesorhizobium caraganae]
MAMILRPDTPAKCCSYCGSRDHDYEDCPKRKADAERQRKEREEQQEQEQDSSRERFLAS